jgi:hypothetical protein
MLEELQRRSFPQTTVNNYLKVVEDFARHFHRPLDQQGKEHIRAYQVYLLQERKLGVPYGRPAHSGSAFLLLQDAEESVSSRRGALSPGTAPTADHSAAGRGDPLARTQRPAQQLMLPTLLLAAAPMIFEEN